MHKVMAVVERREHFDAKCCPNTLCSDRELKVEADGKSLAAAPRWHVVCQACHMRGPAAGDPEGAVKVWDQLPRVEERDG